MKIDPLSMFQPNPGGQTEFWLSTKREQWAMGGNRSGKSEINVTKLLSILLGRHPTVRLAPRRGGWRIWVCTKDKDVQRDTIQEKILKYIPPAYIDPKRMYKNRDVISFLELNDPKDPSNPINGARLIFKTYEAGVDSFESASLDIALCDEEPPEEIYDALQVRLLDRKKMGNGFFMCAMTPTNGMTWTYERIVEGQYDSTDEMLVVLMSTYENKTHLGEKEIQELEKKMGENQAKARIYGMHTAREGFVLDKFKPVKYPEGHIIPHRKFVAQLDWRDYTPYESIDYGYRNPTAVGFYAVNAEGEVFKYDEIYVSQTTIPVIKAMIWIKRKQYGYKDPYAVYIDPSTRRTESTGTSVFDTYSCPGRWVADIDDYEPDVWIPENVTEAEHIPDIVPGKGEGRYVLMPVPVIIANNDRDLGWERVNEYFTFDEITKRPRLFITDKCKMSILEAKGLTYAPEAKHNAAKEIARKKRDHTCDELRYLIMSNPYHDPDFMRVVRKPKSGGDVDVITGY